ncbi:helix-turn-helix domain-containing protein [Microbacterium dauci]|uniref:Helix-turn-helix domain-containing protein n=1 Tax=Microbacterium dauci TaxID=3048008 RepID=A0ABT6ZGW1_9MICO|nr:helix-turn-helix domain-containing protein [Microbacterium sp. LX3-4]MDJ1115394.1 helix-turn-helix domain-containing protein [Microbacterium sp. LX3-4]
MTVWAEQPRDGGSAVWGCTTCDRGEWCWDHTTAILEARTHARTHGTTSVNIIGRKHGPTPKHDTRIHELHQQGLTTRAIATLIGITHTTVAKALRRIGTTT